MRNLVHRELRCAKILQVEVMQNLVASVIPTTEKSQLYCENGDEIMRIVVPSFTLVCFIGPCLING